MQNVKSYGVKFNSSTVTADAKTAGQNTDNKGTIYFTTDEERIILNGTDFSGVKKVEESTTNGKIKVDGTDVPVHGLGSAAYTDSSAYVQGIQINGAVQTKTNGVVNLPAYPTELPASDVSDWAKKDALDAADVPTLEASKVGLGNVTNDAQVKRTEMGAANGVATLDEDGKVPSTQLPSYVDDVVEAADKAALPTTGESSKIYVTLDNNKTYRWGGTTYVEISESLAIGTTTGTALDGKVGNDHITNTDIHVTTDEKTTWNQAVADIAEMDEVISEALNVINGSAGFSENGTYTAPTTGPAAGATSLADAISLLNSVVSAANQALIWD